MKDKTKFLDTVIEKGIIFLLVFTPLALGTVQQWSVSVMEMTAFSLFCLLLVKKGLGADANPALKFIFILFVLFAGLVLFQILPLPEGLLELISPSALLTYKKFGDYAGGTFHPMSINPYQTSRELLKLLSYAAVFFVIVSHYREKAQVKSLVKTIFFMGCFLGVFALLQRMSWNGRIFWFYPVDEALRSGAGIWGPYINRNHFAGYMEMAIPLGLGLLIYRAPGVHAAPGLPFGRRAGQFLASDRILSFTFLFLAVMFMSATLFMTLSRGGIAAFGISSLFFILITQRRRSLRKKTGPLLVAAGVIVAVLMLASWERLEQRFTELEQERHIVRLRIWQDSVGIVKDYPFFGSGLGTYENAYMRYQTKDPTFFYDHAHNDYVELLTDTGAAGFLAAAAMLSLFFFTVFTAWQKNHGMLGKCVGAGGLASIVAIAVHSMSDFNLHIPANALLFTVICAVTYAAVFNMRERRSSSETEWARRPRPYEGGEAEPWDVSRLPAGRQASRFTPYVAVALACILIFISARDLFADYYYGRVARILDDEKTEELDLKPISESTMPDYLDAVRSLHTAAALSPSRPSALKSLSDLYARLGRWAETMESLSAPLPASAPLEKDAFDNAVVYLKKAISLEPANPDYHLALGQLYETAYKDSARADTEFVKALDAYPRNAPTRYAVAMQYLLAGEKDKALEQARLLARIDDSYILDDDGTGRKTFMIERRPPEYMTKLQGSYLFGALEIAWRASNDPEAVKGIAPDTPEARDVVRAFMEWKGIE